MHMQAKTQRGSAVTMMIVFTTQNPTAFQIVGSFGAALMNIRATRPVPKTPKTTTGGTMMTRRKNATKSVRCHVHSWMTVSVKLLEHTSEVSLLPCSSSASSAVASFTIGFDSLAISINALVRSLE